jgi:hypothetical protein
MDSIIGNLALENLDVDINNDEQKEKWKIKDDNAAEWAMKVMRETETEYQRMVDVVNKEIEQLQLALEKAKKERDNTINFFTSKLNEYFNNIPDNVKKKTKTQITYKLPTGTLKFKLPGIEFKRDEEKLVQWLKSRNMNNYIEIQEKPKWGELKKTVKVDKNKVISEDGEIVDGVEVVETPPEFKVELG